MSKKTISLFSFLFFFLMAISIALAGPRYSGIATLKPSSTQYHLGTTYGFEVNCTDNATDALGNVNATFRLGRPTGTSTDYANNTGATIRVQNGSVEGNLSIYFVNITQSQMGAVGTYNYSWICMNMTSVTDMNASSTVSYAIAQNSTGSGVNETITVYAHGGTASNYTNGNAQSVEGQGNPYADCTIVDTTEGSTNLWRDEVTWTEGSGGATSLGVSSYTVKCNLTGNANFTNNNTGCSYALTVIASGGGGGGGYAIYDGETTTQPSQPFAVGEEWQLPELDQNTVIILVIIGIVILVSRKKKK